MISLAPIHGVYCLVDSPFDYMLQSPAQRRITDAIEAATAATVEAIHAARQAPQPTTPAIAESQGEYLTVQQAASLLGLSTRSVWRRVSAGELPKPHYFGQLARWRRSDLLNLPRHNKPSGRSRPNIPPKST